jgi:hypothetical protein
MLAGMTSEECANARAVYEQNATNDKSSSGKKT